MSIKQGVKYDNPESAKDIPAFIQFHNLNTAEILDPVDSFSELSCTFFDRVTNSVEETFNEFFYR